MRDARSAQLTPAVQLSGSERKAVFKALLADPKYAKAIRELFVTPDQKSQLHKARWKEMVDLANSCIPDVVKTGPSRGQPRGKFSSTPSLAKWVASQVQNECNVEASGK